MIIVGVIEKIIKMAQENNGTVTTAMVVAAGIALEDTCDAVVQLMSNLMDI